MGRGGIGEIIIGEDVAGYEEAAGLLQGRGSYLFVCEKKYERILGVPTSPLFVSVTSKIKRPFLENCPILAKNAANGTVCALILYGRRERHHITKECFANFSFSLFSGVKKLTRVPVGGAVRKNCVF